MQHDIVADSVLLGHDRGSVVRLEVHWLRVTHGQQSAPHCFQLRLHVQTPGRNVDGLCTMSVVTGSTFTLGLMARTHALACPG